jgi:two-component system, chemotaxis family, response regulator Rcp1
MRAERSATALKPFTILLIEDNPGDVRLAQEIFHECGSRVRFRIASDGADGLRQLRDYGTEPGYGCPSLILLDLNLPKMDGWEVLSTIKQEAKLRRIPVIVLTTSDNEKDIRQAYELHANCYVVKPAGLDEFERVVRSISQFWLETAILPED